MSTTTAKTTGRVRSQKATETKPRTCRAKRDLTADTDLLPEVIAESVCDEAERLLEATGRLRGLDLRTYTGALADKALRCYAATGALNLTFQKRLRAPGDAGRDALYAFMRHWLYARLVKEHRHLALALPPEFAIGTRCVVPRRCH